MAKRSRKRSTPARKPVVRDGATHLSGAGGLQVDSYQHGIIAGPGYLRFQDPAARGRDAIRQIKAAQDKSERDVAFKYFRRMRLEELVSQRKAKREMDAIARAIVEVTGRSLKETRRRVAKLRKEFCG